MLSSKQRSYLRGLANSIEPIFQVGKGGVSESMIKQVEEALEAREIIKVHVLNNSGLTPREACHQMAQLAGAEAVQVIGNKFVLYKKSKEDPRIQLP